MMVHQSVVPLVTVLLFVLHHTAARPQGRAFSSSPTLNKVSGGKPQLYEDYLKQPDGMDNFYNKPIHSSGFQPKKVKYNDRKSYINRHDDSFFNMDPLPETQFEHNEEHPYNAEPKQSQDDATNNKYGGLGVILGPQNPLRQLG
ncbi:unnamed protein product [Meganyctiphanes norvegica]|uniref:Hymenoptaecin n=1 Tax=Meganyctiphanes norvegica TaxID=48144 RepID=A0AAV2PV09_MEGNR